jgi:hypothetical protein
LWAASKHVNARLHQATQHNSFVACIAWWRRALGQVINKFIYSFISMTSIHEPDRECVLLQSLYAVAEKVFCNIMTIKLNAFNDILQFEKYTLKISLDKKCLW